MSARFDISSYLHRVLALAPVDLNGAAVDTDVLDTKHCDVLFFEVSLGVTGAASTITLEECTAIDGTGATAIAFEYRKMETAGGDVYSSGYTAATASGFATSVNDGIFYSIRVMASALSRDSRFVRLAFSDPGAATFVSVNAYADVRHKEDVTPTMIA